MPQNPSENTTVNQLPTMVISTHSDVNGRTAHTFSYYPNNLVKTIVKYNMLYWPTIYDSTTFSYDVNNQIFKKEHYTDGRLIDEQYYTYTASSKIADINIITSTNSLQYHHHYNSNDEVDYILMYEDGNSQIVDSTTIIGNTVTTYRYRLGIDPEETLQNGYMVWGTDTYHPSANGIHHTVPTCLTKSIDFQTEVAACFIEIGETDFINGNYFYIPSPRKYASSADGTTFTYTFDQNNRLTKIEGEFPNFAPSGSQIPGITSTSVYY